jgi:RND family efflux transporter MFP subunit
VTPLVSGRVERVAVELGDAVRAGSVLAVIVSPEIAQMHGKLHEAETRVALAERNHARVMRAENRAAVLAAKARLDEAEATLRRTRKLVELGAGAGKDLIAAETAYKTAKADFDFQSNIALNKEVQEAKAELETARVDAQHIRTELAALGAPASEGEHGAHDEDSARLVLRAPAAGVVTERLVNSGAGVQAGQSLFTVSNLATVWVIANVPEGQVHRLLVGSTAEIRTPAAGDRPVEGRVTYVAPALDETTRTARVRVEVANPGGRLKAGMFVEVGFSAGAPGSGSPEAQELVVPSSAVERVGERTVVFVPKDGAPGRFEARDVEVGGEADGYKRVVSGLELGERVVTKGTFTLKTQLARGELGGHDH